MLIDSRHVKSITKDARHLFASKAGYELITSAAILSDSIISIYLANSLIRVHFQKNLGPCKAFHKQGKGYGMVENLRLVL